ncbi:MAG: restriction endonuclease subunit S, partial [Hyphomonadaceae bacterium]|nr:restriction endonuclease subunit S [Hyphomonadaceae bacterium]
RSFTYYSTWAIQQELKQYEHTGTVFGAINKKQLGALSVLEPTPEFVALFEDRIAPLDERIRNNVAESRTLAAIRDLLLPKLMSGEIRLREAEKTAESGT